MIPVFELFKV